MSKEENYMYLWYPISRPDIPVPVRKIDQKVEVVQGKSDTVAKLYQDYVLGRLDPSQIGNAPVYDDPNSDSVDPFNHFGVTLEDATRIEDEGKQARKEFEAHVRKKAHEKMTPPETPPSKNPPDGE